MLFPVISNGACGMRNLCIHGHAFSTKISPLQDDSLSRSLRVCVNFSNYIELTFNNLCSNLRRILGVNADILVGEIAAPAGGLGGTHIKIQDDRNI